MFAVFLSTKNYRGITNHSYCQYYVQELLGVMFKNLSAPTGAPLQGRVSRSRHVADTLLPGQSSKQISVLDGGHKSTLSTSGGYPLVIIVIWLYIYGND